MQRKTQLVLIGLVFTILLGGNLAGTQSGQAAHAVVDCESDLWNAFIAANSTYTSTFRSWYRGDPISCNQQCTPQCNGLSGAALTTCMNNCITSCDSTRFAAFQGAQQGLIDVASQTCPVSQDQCAAARARRDACNATYQAHLADPMLDENGNYDLTWLGMVFEEHSSCMAASLIEACE
jgi:hypothetical protein